MTSPFEIFLTGTPGLEPQLLAEAQAQGFQTPQAVPGGVTITGGWPDVWRANLVLRGATRVLARIGSFMAFHPAQLDKRARKFPWDEVLRRDVPVRVDVATSRRSKIYHAGAATERVTRALTQTHGMRVTADAPVTLKLRIDDNRVTISVDSSGESLHRRGAKLAINKAPLRETLAALMLRACGFDGAEPVLDPMCGAGTFLLEAAEMAAGLAPGRNRGFAFENLATFRAEAWDEMRAQAQAATSDLSGPARFLGFDRDAGAVRMATQNASRAGLADLTGFATQPVSALTRPDGSPGLVICNPPYGGRIGQQKLLFGLYATLGERLRAEFAGWRVGLVTSEPALARATGLPFGPKGPAIPHGGLKVWLFQTAPL